MDMYGASCTLCETMYWEYSSQNVWGVQQPQCMGSTAATMYGEYSSQNVWGVQQPECMGSTVATMYGEYSSHNVWAVQQPQCMGSTAARMYGQYSSHNVWGVQQPQCMGSTAATMYGHYSNVFLCSTGFRIRWLMESYLGLRHVPFEHFACSIECARSLNDSFQGIQARLKRQHDEAYQSMLDQYAGETGGVASGGSAGKGNRRRRRGRGWSLLGRRTGKQLEIREMWCTEWASPGGNGQVIPGNSGHSRHLHHHGDHSGRQGNHRGRSSCSIM